MEMLAPTDVIDWSADFAQAITAAAWTVVPTGAVTVATGTIVAETGVATTLISGNSAALGNVYTVRCTATIAGGVTDVRTFYFKIGDKAVS